MFYDLAYKKNMFYDLEWRSSDVKSAQFKNMLEKEGVFEFLASLNKE